MKRTKIKKKIIENRIYEILLIYMAIMSQEKKNEARMERIYENLR